MKVRSSPHPALCATFSRKREKGLHRGLRRTVLGLADCSAARCRLSRKWERMPGGQVRVLFAVKPKSSPHPALRTPFSRKREKGWQHGFRPALHTLRSSLVSHINTRQLHTQTGRQCTCTHQCSRSNHVRMEVTIVHQGRHLRA